jgi:hypothetical protein
VGLVQVKDQRRKAIVLIGGKLRIIMAHAASGNTRRPILERNVLLYGSGPNMHCLFFL